MIRAFLSSCRIREWSKNIILLAGVVFSHHFFDSDYLFRAGLGFLLFSLTASSIYILNDLADRDKDRAHPKKMHRPIASGRLPAGAAWAGFLVLAVVSIGGGFWLWPAFGLSQLVYFLLNAAYSFALKRMVVLDILSIAIGFVIRAIAGVQALRSIDSSVLISPWLLVCTFFASLFLAAGKRRSEMALLETAAASHRASLEKYSVPLIDHILSVTTGATLLSFSLYTIWPDTVEKFGTDKLIYTIPFVAYGLFRYMYLVVLKGTGGNPAETLLADGKMMINIFLWVVAVMLILYVP